MGGLQKKNFEGWMMTDRVNRLRILLEFIPLFSFFSSLEVNSCGIRSPSQKQCGREAP